MGTISLESRAQGIFQADRTRFTFTFSSKSTTVSDAVNELQTQCQTFLKILEKEGIDISKIRFESDDISQDYSSSKFTAKRKVSFNTEFNMQFNNHLINLIKESNHNISLSTEHMLSNYADIHNDLLKKAIADSKKQAELIAESMGTKIIGYQSINPHLNRTMHEHPESCGIRSLAKSIVVDDCLSPPQKTEHEHITIVWITE